MSNADVVALVPLIVIAATAILVMMGIAFRRNHALAVALTLAGLTVAFISIFASPGPRQVTRLLVVDGFALFYFGLIIASAAIVAVISFQYFRTHCADREELYLLLLIATLGCAVLAASAHFISFLLGLEILSISLYGMVAYSKDRGQALEAGMKYLVLASASAAFLLFGAALIYCSTGTMEFAHLRHLEAGDSSFPLLIAGMVLTITGIGFKLGIVPFHLWIPDVYQGAPAPITAYVATTSKVAVVALLLRYAYLSGALSHRVVVMVFAIIAIASMVAGNLLALRQQSIKRILAYSSIAHFGYILVAFVSGASSAIEAVTFYLISYTVTTLSAFGVVAILSNADAEADNLESYSGLFWRRPVLTAFLTAAVLSLAGIPATIGFLGKFYVLAAGAESGTWLLMIVLAATSVIGLFYYLRILAKLYEPSSGRETALPAILPISVLPIAVAASLIIGVGIFPAPVLNWIRTALVILNQ
jgi:NADH-quinone oxidoreductase subunit N